MRLAAALAATLLFAAPSTAQNWVVDKAASSVQIETSAFGQTVTGAFSDFDAQITLDPADLSGARIEAVVRTASGALNNAEQQSAMEGRAGLDPATHPEARFVSEAVTRTPAGYAAAGVLTIKDQSRDAVLAFTLDIQDGRAVADGGFTVARADFGVGAAGWGDAGQSIDVLVRIEADAAD